MSARVVFRTLFYQFFLLVVGISLGFVANAEYIGWKSVIVERSFYNIFFPVQYGPEVEQYVIDHGRKRLALFLTGVPVVPPTLTFLDEYVWNEEVYIAKYRFRRDNGETVEGVYDTRVRWKPWEYYYEYHPATGAALEQPAPPENRDVNPAAPEPPQP